MVQYPEIDPVIVALGPIKVHWYGMMYLIGLAAAYGLALHHTRRPWSPVRRDQVDDMIFYGALGVIVGGRIGSALFYNFDKVLSDPLWVLRVWEGGMAFHGGLLGVGVGAWLFARKINRPMGEVFDYIAPCAPIGLGMGRLGNFIGQELWGKPWEGSWAMVFPNDPLQLPRHPSQLYQAFLEGVLLFIIVYAFARKPRPAYSVTGVFLIFYGLFRFIVEFVREPDAHIGYEFFGWVTRGQILSVPMVLGGVLLLVFAYWRHGRAQAESTTGQ